MESTLFVVDWIAVFKIVMIDIMLGGDNAIIIALACAALPAHLRTKAIIWGTFGAVAIRAILLTFASTLVAIPYVKLIAGAFLLYIGYKLLMDNEDEHSVKQSNHIWGAVWTIVVADLMMSIDNVLAVTAASQSAGEHALGYAIFGIVLSIPIIVWGSKAVSALMDKFPIIIWGGGGLLGWIGAEMMISDNSLHDYIERVHNYFGDYTHLAYKLAGFVAVVFTVIAITHLSKHREAAKQGA